MTEALDLAGLHALYAAGRTTILPTPHAARILNASISAIPRRSDATSPEPRPLLSWSQWVASLWSGILLNGADDRILLNPLQETELWSDILRSHIPFSHRTSLREAATLARSGLQLAAAYRVLDRLRSEADTQDSHSFVAALDRFRTHCARHRLLSPALLEEALADHLNSGTLLAPEALHIVGFEQETPAQRYLLAAMQTHRSHIGRHAADISQPPLGERLCCVLPDRGEELRFAVRLIAEQAHAGEAHYPSIALIRPAGSDDRPELERLFRELLAPELESVHVDLSSTPWHFVDQPTLRSAPIIATALDIVRWTRDPLPLERIGQLLLSPFLTHSDPLESRARFDIFALRRWPILLPALDLVTFLALLRAQSGSNKEQPVSFAELRALSRAAEQAELATARRSHAQWADDTRQLLHSVGWPGPRALSPAEFRAVNAWDSLLDLLSTLDVHGQKSTFSAFLERLIAEAGILRSPGVNPEAPLQVLTLEDTEGLSFDLTIVLDATDKHLPSVEQWHPLLSQGLQRSLGIGDIAHSLTQTRAFLDSLARRSDRTVLLAPANEEDCPSNLTPLAPQLGFRPVDSSAVLPAEVPQHPVTTEVTPEMDSLPPLHDVEVSGGADVLRLQAACGFRAFASLRLAASEPQGRELGLNALDAGRLIHKALELLWASLETQASLRSLSMGARRELVSEAVRNALTRLRPYPHVGHAWSEHFLKILERRFSALLLRWLEMELLRSPFTVRAQEQQQILTLGPIRLKLRPDRIDEVDGGLVFVDYKSSYDLTFAHWLDTRPDAPQLPAYALCADPDPVQGIAFAQIRPDQKKLGWISLSEHPGIFPKTRNKQVSMRDQVEEWRHELTALAEQFAAGDTRVNPKSYPETCRFCVQRALCRLDPTTLLEGAELDNDELTEEELLRG